MFDCLYFALARTLCTCSFSFDGNLWLIEDYVLIMMARFIDSVDYIYCFYPLQKAMSLYHKQSTRYVKLAAPEKGCSEETKRLVSESSKNEVDRDGGDSASLVKLPLIADDPADNMQVGNAMVQESDHLVSDSVPSAVAHDAGESIVSLSRIPNSDENTH